MLTIDEAKQFASDNGLVISKHFIKIDEPEKFTMWIAEGQNANTVVIPVCEEEAFLEAVTVIKDSHDTEIQSRKGKQRYTVGIKEAHINYIRVAAENKEQAKKYAAEVQASAPALYTEYSHTLSEELWIVEEISWED